MAARPHAVVAMPFGVKPGPRGANGELLDPKLETIDFNRVYEDFIAAALELAGLEPFGADQEKSAGDIIPAMFQSCWSRTWSARTLLLRIPTSGTSWASDTRAQSRCVIVAGRVTPAFDTITQRRLIYRLTEWATNAKSLEEDRASLAEMITATMKAWHGRKISPVYDLLPNPQEPDCKTLRIGEAVAFWEQHDAWKRRIDLARRAGQIGALLVLATKPRLWRFASTRGSRPARRCAGPNATSSRSSTCSTVSARGPGPVRADGQHGSLPADTLAETVPASNPPIKEQVLPIAEEPVAVSPIPVGGVLPSGSERD